MFEPEGYIAFTDEQAQRLEAAGGLLTPKAFGYPWHWVPFAFSKEDAIVKAMRSRHGLPPEAAEHWTFWQVLHIRFPFDEFWQLFQKGHVKHASRYSTHTDSALHSWRLYGEVELRKGNRVMWWQVKHPPIGLDSWAKMALTRCLHEQGECCGCKASSVPVWSSSKKESFCAACWKQHYMTLNKEAEGVEEPGRYPVQEAEAAMDCDAA